MFVTIATGTAPAFLVFLLLQVCGEHWHTTSYLQFSYITMHLPNGSFCTPSRTLPMMVSVHHPPLPNSGFHTPFCTPLPTHPTVVSVHHCMPTPWRVLYTIMHPSHCGFCTPLLTRPMVVFIHHRPPTQQWFLYTIAHPQSHHSQTDCDDKLGGAHVSMSHLLCHNLC